ncbi:hypothetical protein GCM10018954_084250 [Kutzneria kofuensis]
MHLVAQLAQRQLRVALGVLLDQTGQDVGEGGAGVVQGLEVEQAVDERAPLALGDAIENRIRQV